jgi:hypothetical protein
MDEPIATAPASEDVRRAVCVAVLDRFFAESGLSPKRRDQADQILTVAVDTYEDGDRSLSVTFDFAGATSEWSWDGSLADAERIGDELGHCWAFDAVADQRHGPTGWEPEFEDVPMTLPPSAADKPRQRVRTRRAPRDVREEVGPVDLIPH